MSIAKISRLNVSFADGEVLTAAKLNTVISGINTAVDKMNECVDALNDGPSGDVVEFFNEDYVEYYGGTVAELYFSVTNVVSGYSFRHYNGSVIAKGIGTTTSDVKWTCRNTDAENMQNGVVYPLQVTMEGSDSSVLVGDIVGYVIFKDISKFRNYTLSSAKPTVITSLVQDIDNSPTVKNYISSNENE